MTTKSMSSVACRDRIMEIAGMKYRSDDEAALEYLQILDSAALEERKVLFELVITVHGIREQKESRGEVEGSIPKGEWETIVKRIAEMVKGWSRAAIQNNASLKDTASLLWDQLQTVEGNDRIAALGLLLALDVVPYGQVPGDLTMVKPADVYEDAQTHVIDQIATLRRIRRAEGITSRELAVAAVKLMDQIEEEDDRVAFLYDFVAQTSKDLYGRSCLGGSLLSSMLGDGLFGSSVLIGPFHRSRSTDDDAESAPTSEDE